jgi:molecular chaperone DnaJ
MPAMGEPDYYHILGISRDASPEAVKHAYHRLAAQFHPDLHPEDPDAEARLRSLNQAYAILRDPEQRRRYDRWGAWGPPLWSPPRTSATHEWLAAVVKHLLRAHAQLEAHKPQRGADLRYALTITPDDSQRGIEVRIRVPAVRWCPHCSGSRLAGGKPPFPCPRCRGTGETTRPGGSLSAVQVCDLCQGKGMVLTDPCRHCAGQGAIGVMRTLTIEVPAGVREGSRLRLRGEGGPGRWGGSPGDLFVDIHLAPQSGHASQAQR